MADVMVELGVLLRRDLVARPRPQRGRRVHRLGVLARLGEANGHGDMVGIGLDDVAQTAGLEEFLGVVAHVQDDAGAADVGVGFGNGEAALAVRLPHPGLALAGLAAGDLDKIGDHEGGVEADAELPDQRHVLARVAAELFEEGAGAGAGDGAQILDQILAVHADAVVGDGDGRGVLVDGDRDLEGAAVGGEIGLGQGRVAEPVAGVGGIGDQLPQEDLLVRIDRVDHQVEDAPHLGLELQCILAHGAVLSCDVSWLDLNAAGTHMGRGAVVQDTGGAAGGTLRRGGG